MQLLRATGTLTAIADLAGPIGKLIAVIAALTAAIVGYGNTSAKVGDVTVSGWDEIVTAVLIARDSLVSLFDSILSALSAFVNYWLSALDKIAYAIGVVFNTMKAFVGLRFDALTAGLSAVKQGIADFDIARLGQGLSRLTDVKAALADFDAAVKTGMETTSKTVISGTVKAATAISTAAGSAVVKGIGGALKQVDDELESPRGQPRSRLQEARRVSGPASPPSRPASPAAPSIRAEFDRYKKLLDEQFYGVASSSRRWSG